MKNIATRAELMEAISYDHHTGIFRWRIKPCQTVSAGSEAGSLNNKGYRRIRFRGNEYACHRLAWLFVTGRWPDLPIDHRNRVRDDNRIDNLRLATPSQNSANTGESRGTLPRGVTLHRRTGKYQAQIKHEHKSYYLGLFDDPERAHSVYCEHATRLYGEFAYSAGSERPQ